MFYAHGRKPGFTIVELLIVIVVIAILATITIVVFNGIQQRAAITSTTADATMVAKKVKLYEVDNGGFPTSLDAAAANLPDTTLSGSNQIVNYTQDGVSFSYCVMEVKGSDVGAWTVYDSSQAGVANSGYQNPPSADCTTPPPEFVNGIRCPVITFGTPFPRPGDPDNRYRVNVDYTEPTISRIDRIGISPVDQTGGEAVYIDQGALDRYDFYRSQGVSWNNALMRIRGVNDLYRYDCTVTWSWPAD